MACFTHHQKIIEEEDLPLVKTHPLGAVGIWDLIELAAANKTTMWKRKNLKRGDECQEIYCKSYYSYLGSKKT